jgi:hypothetical protein
MFLTLVFPQIVAMRKTSSFLLRPPATQTVRCMFVHFNNLEAELAGHVASGMFVAVGGVA